ncbi:MAG: AI-2E family transporter, partial [Mesorhizobium sp.]|nr:AI-2E family transporter [Mesorhizobium sp.]
MEAQLAANEELVEAVVGNALRRQIAFWAGALLLLIGFLYLFSSILLPFAAGMVLAYFLDPVADRLEAWLGSRLVAAIVILLAFVIALVLALMVIVPILATQGADLISKMPEYLARLQALITSIDPEWLKQRFGVDPNNLRSALNSLVSQG